MAGLNKEYQAITRFSVIDRAKHIIPDEAITWEEIAMSQMEFLETAYGITDASSATSSAKANIKDGINTIYGRLFDNTSMRGDDIVQISLRNPPSQSVSSGRVYHKPQGCAYVIAKKGPFASSNYNLTAYDKNGNALSIDGESDSGGQFTTPKISNILKNGGFAHGGTWGGGTGTFWSVYIEA